MNVFDILREKLNKKKEYFQKFYETEGKTEEDADLNKVTQLAFDDAVEIVNQTEKIYNDNLELNIENENTSVEEIVKHLQMHMDLFTFSPATGEKLELWQMNELDKDLYTTMCKAKQFLEAIPKQIPSESADYAHEASYIQGWNECLEKIVKAE